MPVPFIIMPGQAPRPLNVVGEKITVLASSEQTGGDEIFLQIGPEGSGPPPHNHPWDVRKGRFMKSSRIPLFLVSLTCLVVFLAPGAKAGDWDQKTMLYFSEPVEIPTATLPAGNYIFKLMDSPGDRHIVQVLSADERTVYATIEAIPSSRRVASEKTTIIFQDRRAGAPRAIKDWFYPAYSLGHEFVYWNAAPSTSAESKAERGTNPPSDSVEPQCPEQESEPDSTQQVSPSEESSYMQLVKERQRQ